MRSVQLVLGLMVALGSSSAAAQQVQDRVEIAGGWRFYHSQYRTPGSPFVSVVLDNDAPKGWFADTAVKLSPKFALVGEVGGTYQEASSRRTSGVITFRETADVRFHTFLGGARVLAPQHSWFVPFGQVLYGWQRDRIVTERSTSISNLPPSVSTFAGTTSDRVLALDGGATVGWPRFGVRASLGYARFFGAADLDALRLSVGASTRF